MRSRVLVTVAALVALPVTMPVAQARAQSVPPPQVPLSPAPLSPAPLPPTADADKLDTPAQTLEKAGAVVRDLAGGDVKALRRGPLLIHGNFCGIGGRPGLAPVDALDAACERHDACTKANSLPSCACNERLEREATAIVDDPAVTTALKTLSAAVAASMAVLICK